MRFLPFLCLSVLSLVLVPSPARAQVTDGERAAARDLFKQGDELQRASKFAEALDKFQRAEQVYSAPTNLLRIAECDAALGRLVESAEAYRAVFRAPLPPGSPPAFQAAVDQARAELAQVEPRVPRLVVSVEAQGKAPRVELTIDGQSVHAALVGEAMPLDPGAHRVVVSAAGYTSAELQVVLKEQESKTVVAALKPLPSAPPPAVAAPARTDAPPPSATTSSGTVPPPPPPLEMEVAPAPKVSQRGLLLGAHLGWELPGGNVPTDTGVADVRSITTGGPALGLDAGMRFARNWYLGMTLEHAFLGGVSGTTADTTLLGGTLGLILNPIRPSFYGEVGLGIRWFSYSHDNVSKPDSAGELAFGAGAWLPASKAFRLLPKATLGLGTFNAPASSPGHVFLMLGVTGFYNLDL